MSLNSNKKKGRTNTNSKIGRPKGLSEKNLAFEGVYSNARFMHAAASLVGCVVQVQVKNGNVYEGIFRTFSHQLDLVLEMTHKVDKKAVPAVGVGQAVSNLLSSFTSPDGVTEKLIFKLHDVVMLSAVNVDLDYATRDNFTDTGISKFNGQVPERELEPWDGPLDEVDGLTGLDPDGEDSNGWDVDDMFKTNAEKYGVKTSYDNTLLEYTVPLERKNTEEYKKQEAKASKIAQEIEGSVNYQSRIAMENGDEEERFSSVIRPDNLNSSRTLAQRRRPIQSAKRVVSASGPSPIHSKPYPPQYSISTPSTTGPPYKSNSLPSQNCVSSPSPTPASTPVMKQSLTPPSSLSQQPQQRSGSPGQPSAQPVPKEINEPKVNGEESERETQKSVLVTQVKDTVSKPPAPVKQTTVVSSQPLPPRPERITDKCRDTDKKVQRQKGRDDGIEELIKFGSTFKLSEESKEVKEHKEEPQKADQSLDQTISNKHIDQQKDKEKEVEKIKETEIDKCASTVRNSTLNPNAKEFVFNPNAKTFTPRSLAVASPISPVPLQPPRMHTQSPVMALPQHQMVPGMAQPIFTAMTPQYVMSPTPVSVSLTPPFASPASIQQPPRFRKIPLAMQPRHDLSPSVHVAAATGQPILAPAALHTPQLTMQYTPPPGMIPTPGPPQAAMAYPQMYSMVGPRVMSPQPVGLVPTSHTATYGDTHHIPAHLYMSPHPGTALSAVPTPHAVPVSAVPQGATGSHSNPPTPQSQTPGMHAAPSPVHQPPPNVTHVTPAQTPTPTGHPGPAPTPQPVVYHGPMSQHPLQPGPHNPNTPPSQNHHVAHVTQPHPHSSFTGAPQPVVLMPQQAVPGPHVPHPGSIPSSGPHALQGHPIHGQTPGSHAGTPTHVLPPMTVIPTSAAMVPAPAMATAPFVPHPQASTIPPVHIPKWKMGGDNRNILRLFYL